MTVRKCIRILSFVLALLLVGTVLCSCSASRRVLPSFRANRTVARAGNVKIPYANLYYVTMTRMAELKEIYGEDALDSTEARDELKAFVMDNLWTSREALISIGYDYGLDVTKGEIAESVQKHMDNILEQAFGNDRKAYIESLNREYLTDPYVRTYLGVENYLAAAIVQEMITRGELNDSDKAVSELLASDDFICVRQVFVDASRYEDDAAALAKARELRAGVAAVDTDLARANAMIDVIAGQYNNDYGDLMGNGYYYARGEMNSTFEEAAFGLAEYAVSEVIETEGGYAFLMRFPKDNAYMEEHFEELKQKTYYIHLNDMVEKRYSETELEMTKYGEGLELTDLAAIDANGGETALIVISAVVGVAAVVLAVLILRRRAGKKAASGSKAKSRKN